MPRVVNIPQLLTFKQQTFVKEYVKNGNGTQAALKAYDTTDPDTAHSIAVENLQRPPIQRSIQEIAGGIGITEDTVLARIGRIGSKEAEKWSGDAILKANIELAKILRMYPDKKSYQYSMTVKGNIKDLNYSEAKKQLDDLNNNILDLEGEEAVDVA